MAIQSSFLRSILRKLKLSSPADKQPISAAPVNTPPPEKRTARVTTPRDSASGQATGKRQ